uniref:Macrophage migration inhibitory factor n=1 Tax=Ciona intestinalis TaxID=7719 RepID=H2Y3S3_CIOIN|nr:macrophage migration inhibitory factor-like [Ciona intestinalis]|eukprot:XP_002120737.1 macrophage migration inhibitory factor-like [Ciona intestinalis]
MPHLFVKTNVAKDKLPKSILQDLTKLVSSTIPNKPEKYVCVTVVPDVWMSFGGTEEPCAAAVLTSISDFNAETCTTYAEAMLGEIYKLLGVAQDRMYLEFHEATRETMGYNGTTFHQLAAKK